MAPKKRGANMLSVTRQAKLAFDLAVAHAAEEKHETEP
jgi:hypothetical protein